MKVYRTTLGGFVEEDGQFYELSPLASAEAWDKLTCDVDLKAGVAAAIKRNSVARFGPGDRPRPQLAARKCGPPESRTFAAAKPAWKRVTWHVMF